jgi:hypothetical protein
MEYMETTQPQQPIGYWLKHVDRLIDAAFDRTLATEGVQRRHWQTLQVLAAAPRTEAELADALAPFFTASAPGPETVLAELRARGWLSVDHARAYTLTSLGKAAHARLTERVLVLRRQTSAGISQDDYGTTLNVLARMADNLLTAVDERARIVEFQAL